MIQFKFSLILGVAALAAPPLPAGDRPPTIELRALSSVTAITPGSQRGGDCRP